MKRTILFFIVLIQFHQLYSQNLVSNGGFEENTGLPVAGGQWYYCEGWNSVNNLDLISSSGHASPDYYHNNSTSGAFSLPFGYGGKVNAHTDNAIMGLIVEHPYYSWREYISTNLNSPMVVGKEYQFSFWISLGGLPTQWKLASDGVGALLSTYTLHQASYEPIALVPQFKVNTIVEDTIWRKFSFNFIADSAYSKLTIGHFGSQPSATSVMHPSISQNGSYYYIDDVELICTSEDCENPNITFAPNVITPNGDDVNDYFSVDFSGNIETFELLILNRWGNIVFKSDNPSIKWYGTAGNNSDCLNGTYFWLVSLLDKNGNSFQFNGMVNIIE